MSLQTQPKDIFSLLDKEDEKQIIHIEHFGKIEDLIYLVHNQPQLSYAGIKHIGFLMAKTGHALQTTNVQTELFGEGEEKTWYSTVTVTNQNTKQEEIGASEAAYYDKDGKVDHFARTKAISKAERNAKRKLIPEYMLTATIKDAMNKGQVKNLGGKKDAN